VADPIFDTIVIGGGQTGLTVGHELAKTGRTFVILDASTRVGDAWRNRWDSLVLFTPAGFSGLPGMDFPAAKDRFITKHEAGDFVESYAREMGLPVLSGTKVERLTKEDDLFRAETAGEVFSARNVVVAMANYQEPKVPVFAGELDPSITQIHTADYRNPDSVGEGPTLVVGMGNSGAEIGLELARSRQTYLSGKPTAVIPFNIESWFGRKIGSKLVRFFATRVLTTTTPIGRRARPKMLQRAAPVVRAKPKDLARAGVERVPRVTGVRDGLPELADGRALDVRSVVWCTGYQRGFKWIDLPVFGDDGRPRHHRGIADDVPGLYFCGLFFQHSLWSETFPGMPRDARYVVEHLENRAIVGAHVDAPSGA
jgi:putative flavoprotein involved in K+ transport